jgi:pyruvate dehydrogenase E1 component alpha subunit
VPDLYRRAEGYGVRAVMIDGNEVLTVYETAKQAVADCRAGNGPVMIEAKTYRHGGHHVNDQGAYLPKDKLEYYHARDPVKLHREYMLQQGGFTEDDVRAIETDVERLVEDAAEFARQSPEPSVAAYQEETACL